MIRVLFENPFIQSLIFDPQMDETLVLDSALFRELRALFVQLRDQGAKPVVPQNFMRELSLRDRKYRQRSQEDAEEFFRDVLSLLHDDLGVCCSFSP